MLSGSTSMLQASLAPGSQSFEELFKAGCIANKKSFFNDAETSFSRLVEICPEDEKNQALLVKAHYWRGVNFFAMGIGKYPRATVSFQKALKLDDSQDLKTKGLCRYYLGLIEKSKNAFPKAMGMLQESIRLLQPCTEAKQIVGKAQFNIGQCLVAQDDSDNAKISFEKALKLFCPLKSKHYHLALFEIAKINQSTKKYDEAQEPLEEVYWYFKDCQASGMEEMESLFAKSAASLGLNEFYQKRFDAAKVRLKEAIQGFEKSDDSQLLSLTLTLAFCEAHTNKLETAKEIVNSIVEQLKTKSMTDEVQKNIDFVVDHVKTSVDSPVSADFLGFLNSRILELAKDSAVEKETTQYPSNRRG